MALPWIRPVVAKMSGYVPGEQPQANQWVKLNTNENPYPPSPRVLEALRNALGAHLRLYPDPLATPLREAAARRFGLRAEQILVGNGSDELITLILRACVEPGEAVAYPWPTYSLYDVLVTIEHGQIEHHPFEQLDRLPRSLWKSGAKLIFVCHPNSPTSVGMRMSDIEELLRARSDGLIVVDEAYADFADDSAVRLLDRYANLLVLRSFSKSFSLAGLRLGLALGAAGTIAELVKVKDSYNVDRLAIVAGVAALEDAAWMEENARRVKATRAWLSEELRRLGFEVPQSQANFVFARKPGKDLAPVYLALKRQGILVRHFPIDGLRDALRITVGTEDEVRRLLAALTGIQEL